MSGLAGVMSPNREFERQKIVDNMLATLNHRGPGIRKKHSINKITMGMTVNVEKEQQVLPYVNEYNNKMMICDATIFNSHELGQQLKAKGHYLRTGNGEEILLHLYEEWGLDGLQKVNGFFSLVIYDKNTDKLIAARDPFGVKPLYYHQKNGTILFSSELKGIVASNLISPKLNSYCLNLYLILQYPPEPYSMIDDVYRVLPGTAMTFNKASIESTYKYHTFVFNGSNKFTQSKPKGGNKQEIAEQTKTLFQKSIQEQFENTSNPGAFLSSGIDSSSVVALLNKKYVPGISTFSVGFHFQKYDELEFIKNLTAQLQVNNYQKLVSLEELKNELRKFVWHLDEPVADPSAFGLYKGAELASNFVKEIFSGEGADEFFGGYNIYQEPLFVNKIQKLPSTVLSTMNSIFNIIPYNIKGKSLFKRANTPLSERYFGNAMIFTPAEKDNLISKEHQISGVLDKMFKPIYKNVEKCHDVNKMQYVDINSWMTGDIMLKVDRMLMAHSLSLRAPFLNLELTDWAYNLPVKWKVSQKETKIAFRRAMNDILPQQSVVKKKLGFPVPTDKWFENSLITWAKDLLLSNESKKYFNPNKVKKLMKPDKKTDFQGRKLWTLLIFLLWQDMYLK
ncbi:asparagine synthase (glutamine-hydrolyzing) [Natranaerobius thermophilus]|uniref:asparagine synthase (glutamine-hydrolyzing) n=1 Tax=Natranaerobius thermophilus (strain ATCC BAA-1301 / DSM 18059 / JW/NM-WN-LF) TaxID=457570 RepID=B2A331_NATTJ|nr:asparagine synthase (glutamine-hydrolyzing) [Natranaerobius thermophilus]ACB84962.1 Asparagine synthase (glutamine-hydrolyzing) [Natranaerobius thermophilus JW/NM-WN-LF]